MHAFVALINILKVKVIDGHSFGPLQTTANIEILGRLFCWPCIMWQVWCILTIEKNGKKRTVLIGLKTISNIAFEYLQMSPHAFQDTIAMFADDFHNQQL